MLNRQQPESKRIADDYLGDMDLPSSESESDGEAPVVVREEKKDIIRMAQATPLNLGQKKVVVVVMVGRGWGGG